MQAVSLKNWRFISFLAATFLGAFNDNAFKLVVSMASLSLITDPAKQQSYLAMTSALAILPFVLFSGYAGYLADRFAKSQVLRISKAAEILAMLAALIIFMTGQSITHLLVTLFLLALHSAFFSPSKYGILPEILSAENLPKANGYLNMLTFVAIILGSLSGATLWGMFKHDSAIIGMILTGVAVLGTVLCLFVPQSAPGNAQKVFKLNPFSEIARGVTIARGQLLIATCMLGSAMFWMLGGLIYLSLILLGKTQLGLSESASGSLFAFLASGIAVVSGVAGYLVGKTVRLTLSVWGALILGAGCVLTGFYATSYTHTAILMSIVGLGGGLFVVPIVTLLQKNSPEALRGQVLATSGFFDMVGVLLASGVFWLLGTQAGLSSSMIILAAGVLSLGGICLFVLLARHKPHTGELPPAEYAVNDTLGRRFILEAKRHVFAARMSDTTGQRLNSVRSLAAARLMAQWLMPRLGDTQNVGVLLPASVGGAFANISLALLGKTSVNLNFSLGLDTLEQAVIKADVKYVITSHKVVKKLGIAEDARMLFMDDAVAGMGRMQKLRALAQALFLPRQMLCRYWLQGKQQSNATATILFSSGSTASPKAVMLSHRNIISNIDSVSSLLAKEESKADISYRHAGVLPFFHSFGLTACLWLPAITGREVSYHSNPLEAKTVTRMIAKEKCHILICTPTFARHYTSIAKEHALDSLRLVILGGEKLTEAVEKQLADALPNAHVLQGYGCTELGPVVAINVPDDDSDDVTHRGCAKGSVGKPIPGVTVRIADRDNGNELGADAEGLILVQSPSMMQGYYGDAALTREVCEGGWYYTGDIGMLDKDGFLYITDRLSRFSKIGGEMVPHGKVEEAVQELVSEGHTVAVVAIADDKKGEQLCVLTTEEKLKPADIHAALKKSGLPNLWIPAREHIFVVDALPQLATGKRDLRAIKKMAEDLVSEHVNG